MIKAIKTIADEKENMLFIISGSTKQFMEGIFSKFHSIGLVADGGNSISWPSDVDEGEREWEDLKYDSHDDSGWKSITLQIMQRYTLLTNGSSIDNNPHQLRWDIQFTDPEVYIYKY